MRDAFKLSSWLLIIVGWAIALVAVLVVLEKPPAAFGLGVLAVGNFVGWAMFLSWLFGLRRRVKRHMGAPISQLVFLEKEIGASRLNDVRRALERWLADKSEPTARRYGLNMAYQLSRLQHANPEIEPLQWTSAEAQSGEFEVYPKNAVYLLFHDGMPFVVCARPPDAQQYVNYEDEEDTIAARKGVWLQVLAPSLHVASAVVAEVLRQAGVCSVYRGKMLHVSRGGGGSGGRTIRVSDRPAIDSQRIVLPQQLLAVLRRCIGARLQFSEVLSRHGHAAKTGILLHGAPGTGKTLVCKQIIGACPNHTAIVPTGMETEAIRESFRLAAYLQPAVVVIEDVDLLAERRDTSANVTGLQELMNEMDGLASSAQAVVVMTTNRPDKVEPALASRPGRISQALEFPLPTAPLRDRILRLYLAAADAAGVSFDRWVARTEGASPAFLEELAKRAILFAVERALSPNADSAADSAADGRFALEFPDAAWGAAAQQGAAEVSDEDLDRAIHELVILGGKLTTNVLGFPQAGTAEEKRGAGERDGEERDGEERDGEERGE